MSTETTAQQPFPPEPQPERTPRVNFGPRALEGLKFYEREIATYLRELPRLIQEGEAGRHAIVKGDEILSIWDTFSDALQAGTERFGLDPLFIKKIDARDTERYARVFAAAAALKEEQCRS